jgi:hypothetical protein
MKSKKITPKYSPEVRERAVRMVQEHRGEYPSVWAAIIDCAEDRLCSPGRALHRRAPDEAPGIARRGARQSRAYDGAGPQTAVSAGSGESPVQGGSSEPALGVGFHLRLDLAGLAIRRLRHRCLCPAHRGAAGEPNDDDGLRAGRAGAGALRSSARTRRQPRCITQIGARSTSASATAIACTKRASNPPWETRATATTTLFILGAARQLLAGRG